MVSHSKSYYVYIMTDNSRTLYVGVTNDLPRRVWEHKQGRGSQFAAKYHIDTLVYYEVFEDIGLAISERNRSKGGYVRKRSI